MFDSSEEELEEDYTSPVPVPLSFPKFKISPKKLNPKVALADEIHKLWGITIPHVMGLIKYKGYQAVLEEFEAVKKTPHPNPPALFQWRLRNMKPSFKDV